MDNNSSAARHRLGPAMVAIFGSALTSLAPDDIDVVSHGLPLHRVEGMVHAWRRRERPELSPSIRIDHHTASWSPSAGAWVDGLWSPSGAFAPIQAVEHSDPVLSLLGPTVGVQVDSRSLPRAVRFFRRHSRLPNVDYLRLGLTRDDNEAAYFGGGLTALRTAMAKLTLPQRDQIDEALGPVFTRLRRRDPDEQELAIFRPGSPGFEPCAEASFQPVSGVWTARTGHDGWIVRLDGDRIVRDSRL